MKTFDYKNVDKSTKIVANEIISLLNEYSLEEGYINIILEMVSEAVETASSNCKLCIDGVY